jgi:hypothetical protein
MMELPRYLKIVIGIFCVALIGNIIFLDYFFVSQRSELLDFQARLAQFSQSVKTAVERNYLNPTDVPALKVATPSAPTLVADTSCPKSCLPLIDSAITTHATKSVGSQAPVAPSSTPAVTVPRGEYFVPLGTGTVSNSESSGTNWKTMETAQATFDAANYGTIKAAYLEVFMRTGGAGEVHARLYESTTPAIFWTSELSTTSTTSVFLSAPITLSSGSKAYKVQMYSTISTSLLDQARIRIVTQ